MKKVYIAWCTLFLSLLSCVGSFTLAQNDFNYDVSVQNSTESIEENIREDLVDQKWATSVNTLIFRIIQDIVIPLVILWWVFLAIIWLYKLFVSDSSDEIWKGTNYLTRWVVGILVMVSARYIGNVVRDDIFSKWSNTVITWVKIAEQLYGQIAYPFLKLGMYLVIWVLFIIVIIRVFKFLTSSEDENQSRSLKIIGWNIIGILAILWSKQLIEAVYGKKDLVLNMDASTIGDIWTWLLADKHIPIVYQIIQRSMWLVACIILIFLLIQWFKILTNPEDDENVWDVRNYTLYALLWLIVIGASYLITNFLVVSW